MIVTQDISTAAAADADAAAAIKLTNDVYAA